MRSIPFTLLAVLAIVPAGFPSAAEGPGLAPTREHIATTGWHARLAIGAQVPSLRGDLQAAEANGNRLSGLSVVGDYYFGIAPRWDSGGGLRASGGLLWGSRLLWAGAPQLGATRPGLSVARQWATALADPAETSTLPYLGVGYSGMLGAGRFGYSADLGLVARSPGNAVRFGRVLGGSQAFDDALRELRLAPVLQLGVSYAF